MTDAHEYRPDPMMMGDCAICGHTREAHERHDAPDMIPRAEAKRMAQEAVAAALSKAAEWHELEATHYTSARGQRDGVDFAVVGAWHEECAQHIRAIIAKEQNEIKT